MIEARGWTECGKWSIIKMLHILIFCLAKIYFINLILKKFPFLLENPASSCRGRREALAQTFTNKPKLMKKKKRLNWQQQKINAKKDEKDLGAMTILTMKKKN